jgi:N,N'-diacetyllegionaminate synthase
MKTVIIAEAGVNHNGDIEIAKKLISAAAVAGADFVKFQSFSTEKSISKGAPKADYQIVATGSDDSQYDMVKKLELTREDHAILIEECRRCGIAFLSTAFDSDSLSMLMDFGISHIKIPSGEITNLPLVRYMASFGKPIILSTGMATIGEVESAIDLIVLSGTARSLITVLHCTTEYPAPMEEVNLRAMITMKSAFDVDVGYSDHTSGIEISIAAVALGAKVIEKHFTLSRNMEGPDHKASLEPDELRLLVSSIRNLEKALGDGVKRPSHSEEKNKLIARKSLVAIKEIPVGELFDAKNIGVKRPGNGISPMYWDQILGRPARRAFKVDEQIEL